jgi:hypothetical protein
MDHWVIRYQDVKNVTRLVPILAETEERALDSFRWFVKDAVEDSITILTVDEFKDLREAYGFDRDTPSEDELTPLEKQIQAIWKDPEFQARLASGGYDDY